MTILEITSVTKDSPGAGQFTAVGTYTTGEDEESARQQVTIGDFPEGNTAWFREVSVRDTVVRVYKLGATAVGLVFESLSLLARKIEGSLTWAPVIGTQPASAACVHASTAAGFTVAATSEDSNHTYQWQFLAKSSAVLTSNNTNVSNNDTVTIAGKTYTFKTALTPAEGEVLIGGSADASLLNLIRAVNHTGTPDTDYKCAAAHTLVVALAAVTAHTATFVAIGAGVTGDAYAFSKSAATLTVSGVTFTDSAWTNATGTLFECAFTNGTTATLTATPTTTALNGVAIRCAVASPGGTTNTDGAAVLTIT